MTRAEALLHRLRAGIAASASVVLVIAHPDDEALGVGGSLGLLQAAHVVQITDGAIRTGDEAGQAALRCTRREERTRAWDAAGWALPCTELGVPDQESHRHAEALIAQLVPLLAAARVVWTHPYEGGHPDHDTAAYVVQTACARLARSGHTCPERVEFASYHWDGTRRVVGRFWPSETTAYGVPLSGDRLVRKQRALAAYTSQAGVIRLFPVAQEYYRIAPVYDFTQPPPPPGCLYERKRWPVTAADWRAAVARVA